MKRGCQGFQPQPLERAFTLIELLVAIGIIATLGAMLLPALAKAKAKEKAQHAPCINNQKQLMMANLMYCQDRGIDDTEQPLTPALSPSEGAREKPPQDFGLRDFGLPLEFRFRAG